MLAVVRGETGLKFPTREGSKTLLFNLFNAYSDSHRTQSHMSIYLEYNILSFSFIFSTNSWWKFKSNELMQKPCRAERKYIEVISLCGLVTLSTNLHMTCYFDASLMKTYWLSIHPSIIRGWVVVAAGFSSSSCGKYWLMGALILNVLRGSEDLWYWLIFLSSLSTSNKHQMAKKSTSPFVPGVGGTHASKVMQSLSSSPSNLSGWVHLIVWSNNLWRRQKSTFEIDLRCYHLMFLIVTSLFFFVFFLSIHSGRMLNAPNTAAPTFTQAYQRQQPPLAPAPPPITHAMATIPHQPAYRAPTDRIFYLAHTCQPACLNRVRPATADMHRGKNPLLTPLLYDFRRMTGRRKVNRKVNMKEE